MTHSGFNGMDSVSLESVDSRSESFFVSLYTGEDKCAPVTCAQVVPSQEFTLGQDTVFQDAPRM
jgi:hypothetical protein